MEMQPIVLVTRNSLPSVGFKTYSIQQSKKTHPWPMSLGQNLGSCGAWNFLWRIGFHPQECEIENLPSAHTNAVLFIDRISCIDSQTQSGLLRWMNDGGKVIATGELKAWDSFLPQDCGWTTDEFKNPHAALAYLLDSYSPQLIAPPYWNFIKFNTQTPPSQFIGRIAAVQGERQTPSRACLNAQSNAPVLIQNKSFFFLNGQPFAALQAWLQGQENLSPWLSWRHRLFWLDEWISFFCDFLLKYNILPSAPRPGISTLKSNTIILRHDLDYSRDKTFLFEENKRQIAGTHAVLKDRNTRYWVKTLKQFKEQEIAFHYNTGKRNFLDLIYRRLTKKSTIAFGPHRKQIADQGLLKQLKWASKNQIGIKTIHRHLYYLIYPEWIDALDQVYDSDLNVLGSSSLFRGQVLRWGIDRVEGNYGFLAEMPDPQFPVWYPFKLSHAGKSGKILKGWELTALMEIEPELFFKIIDHRVKHLTQNIFTLIFHPAHTFKSSLYQEGSLGNFNQILDFLNDHNIEIKTMSHVLEQANFVFGVN